MKKILLYLSGVLMIVAVIFFIRLLNNAGSFKSISPHHDGKIKLHSLPVAGAEDLTLDPVTQTLFISADDRRAKGEIQGSILRMINDSTFSEIPSDVPSDFHPHGISFFRSREGEAFLFVINHRKNPVSSTVDRFEWRNDSLIYQESFSSDELMTSPNDLVATGSRTFYFTNDHGYAQEGIMKTLEEYLQLPASYIGYYNGSDFQKVAGGLTYANGINISPDGRWLYATSTTGRQLHVYGVNEDASLSNGKAVDLETGADNIEVDSSGTLWIGCHPQMLKFVAHAKDPAKRSASQVLRLRPLGDGNFDIKEIFLNDGNEFSGSSVGLMVGKRLFLGSVFEPVLLTVDLN